MRWYHSLSAAILLAVGAGAGAYSARPEPSDVPDAFDRYHMHLRAFNRAYLAGDIATVSREQPSLDRCYWQAVLEGSITRVWIGPQIAAAFASDCAGHDFTCYLSGSQMMGGQHAEGTEGMESTEFNILRNEDGRIRTWIAAGDVRVLPIPTWVRNPQPVNDETPAVLRWIRNLLHHP